MHHLKGYSVGSATRYSARNMAKPVNFSLYAPHAKEVAVVGDFNHWQAQANPMVRQPDGAWHIQIDLHHGHHHYMFVVDGVQTLDNRAQGIARNARNERVSMIAVS